MASCEPNIQRLIQFGVQKDVRAMDRGNVFMLQYIKSKVPMEEQV
jgi:hypothetical protein